MISAAHFHALSLPYADQRRVPLWVAIALSEALMRGHLAAVATIGTEGLHMATVYETDAGLPHTMAAMLGGAGFVRHIGDRRVPCTRWVWSGYNDEVTL